jgi:hypothetical protein
VVLKSAPLRLQYSRVKIDGERPIEIFAFVSAFVLAVHFLIRKKRQVEQVLSLPRESERAWQTERTSFNWGRPTALAAKGEQVLMVTF